MAATYVVSVRDSFRGGGASSVVAVANAASYVGFYGVSRLMFSFLEHNGAQLENARRQAIERGERLATERERNHQHRVLHDNALQVLEAIARGWLSPDAAQTRAAAAAQTIRRALRGDDLLRIESTLVGMLEDLVAEFTARGLTLELVLGPLVDDPGPEARVALTDATREALNNVVKHSGTDHAVVHVATVASRATVTIRDHGRGFDPTLTATGFGLPQSVAARMVEVGGVADIWSQPGRGTRVELSAPT
jgi:signal transduction histidine kinase